MGEAMRVGGGQDEPCKTNARESAALVGKPANHDLVMSLRCEELERKTRLPVSGDGGSVKRAILELEIRRKMATDRVSQREWPVQGLKGNGRGGEIRTWTGQNDETPKNIGHL